jgi:hypothetical protein
MDGALETVYGFDQDGLDNEWRASHGLPPVERAEPTEPAQPGATVAPSGQNEPRAEEDDGGTSAVLIVALAAGFVVLAGAMGLGGWVVARRL